MAEVNHEKIERLVARSRRNDREAFSEIVRMLMNSIVALTYRMTGNREAALDLTQDTFVSAWENLGSFRGEAKFENWLYRIATNKAINYLNTITPVSLDEESDPPEQSVATPEDQFTRKELREAVLAFMRELPLQQRVTFELRFYRQLPFEEIAEMTGRALGTVKTNYREAIIKLRAFATEKGWRP